MSEQPIAPAGEGGAPAPVTVPATPPAPKNDAEAAAQDALKATKPPASEPAKPDPEAEKAQQQKNRTREYIARINRENAELRRQIAERAAQAQPAAPAAKGDDAEPKLEDFDFDLAAFNRAHVNWAVKQSQKQHETQSKTQAEQARNAEILATYNTKVAEFAEEHPDFFEAVGSIEYPLSQELQVAIMSHELGPQIAYHLANNDDDAFQLASVQPVMAAKAVERLAKRLTAAPTAAAPAAPAQPTPPVAPVATKQPTQAPAPPPTLGGRAPVEPSPEKMTDDDWYRRDVERRRKR